MMASGERATYRVIPVNDMWRVERGDGVRQGLDFYTKVVAVEAAKDLAKANRHGRVIIQTSAGEIEDEHVFPGELSD